MIPYELKRSGRRTLAAEIRRDGTVLIRAPFYASKREIDAFVRREEAWIRSHIEKQRTRPASRIPERDDEATVKALKAQARAVLLPKITYYAALLGVTPASVSINRAHTRFGSCSTKNRLNFSCYLMLYPEPAIDYVVVHELCHIREHNHSSAFYTLVASVLPDYKEREAMLRD